MFYAAPLYYKILGRDLEKGKAGVKRHYNKAFGRKSGASRLRFAMYFYIYDHERLSMFIHSNAVANV